MDHIVTKSNPEVELGEAKACCFEGSGYADLTASRLASRWRSSSAWLTAGQEGMSVADHF
jgi:hypothetical protein